MTRFAITRRNDAFLEIQIFASLSSIYLKLCSVAIPMLYCRLDRKRSNTLALYAFLRRLILHVFNYTIITYEYCNVRSWYKDHTTQYETAILIIYKFLRKYILTTEKESFSGLKRSLNNCGFYRS